MKDKNFLTLKEVQNELKEMLKESIDFLNNKKINYYLGYGNRCEKYLWAKDVKSQIAKMKEIWNNLKEKPEWLTMEQILEYEKKMS